MITQTKGAYVARTRDSHPGSSARFSEIYHAGNAAESIDREVFEIIKWLQIC
jgi:hypothetical protein